MKNKNGASYNSGSEFSSTNDRIEETENRDKMYSADVTVEDTEKIAALSEKKDSQSADLARFNKASNTNTNPFGNAASFRSQNVSKELDKTNYDLRGYERSMTEEGGPILDGNGNVVEPGTGTTPSVPPTGPPAGFGSQYQNGVYVGGGQGSGDANNPPPGAGDQGTQNAVYIGGGPPMSNGTGSGRPNFDAGSSMNIKKVSEGASMSDILFKKK